MPLALALSVAAAIAYAVLWQLLKSTSGCGPPGHSTSGRIFSAAPFVFPLLAALALLAAGVRLSWRRRPVALATVTTVVTAGVLEIAVFLFEFGAHRCGE